MDEHASNAFLSGTPWEQAHRHPLQQDASVRRYQRLTQSSGETAILAHDPSATSRARFAQLSQHLLSLDLSPPRVLEVDDRSGFLLLEDLGDARFPELISERPAMENHLYSCATEAILVASLAPAPELEVLSPSDMADQSMLGFEWYGDTAPSDVKMRLFDLFEAELSPPDALIQRDVHAENLLWLPERDGPARIGLLDFQDARLAPPLYDVVSLVEDARRDVGMGAKDAAYDFVAERLGRPRTAVDREAAVLSLQRNIRILGIFVRLCLRDGRPNYLHHLPRVRRHVEAALDVLKADTLATVLNAALPQASTEFLAHLENQCGKIRNH